jgi:xanthine dehydrogenase YagT iron-sulfur-binding subunit
MTRRKTRNRGRTADPPPPAGVSRRNFLTSVASGVVGAAAVEVTARAERPPQPRAADADGLIRLALTVNGRAHRVAVEPQQTLLEVLREQLALTGTKPGCERGECGACTVLIDDRPRYACLTLAVEAEGHAIVTVEGLMRGEDLGLVQQAFVAEDAFQCGYCTPGQVMAVEGLLRQNPNPSLDEIREGMSGNLCRCGAYAHIFKAARRAAGLRRTTAR